MGRPKIDRTGEVRKMNNGLTAKIVAYRGANDIDVEFVENGAIVRSFYHCFVRSEIKCPMIYKKIDNDSVQVTNPNTNAVFIIDVDDVNKVNMYDFWFRDNKGYIKSVSRGKEVRLHKIIIGTTSNGVDHINGNRSDNRKLNLRACSVEQNNRNRKTPITNKSGFKGVYWDKKRNKWRAVITASGNIYSLGWFNDVRRAAIAYNEAAAKHHGEFARLNVVTEAA